MTDYPYVLNNNRIGTLIGKIQQAARPVKLTQEVLKNLGFTSTNDRAMIPLFKKLGFLQEDGTPTTLYDSLKDATTAKTVLATQIKNLYSELYAINTEIQSATEAEIKGAISRVTGKDEDGVNRIYLTFKALCFNADFAVENAIEQSVEPQQSIQRPLQSENTDVIHPPVTPQLRTNEFHYNIQIHLPATTDISVYNAIFKSLKENLLM